MGSIRLHKEHGLNPTMPVCFWCGEEKGEIALLGAAYKGEAPRRMVMDYNPCETCQEHQAQGITFIEATSRPREQGQPPLQEGAYPTGRSWIVKEEAVRMMLSEPMLSDVLEKRTCFVEPDMAKRLFEGADDAEPETNG